MNLLKMKPEAEHQSNRERELSELVDGCYAIVELYKPQSPSQDAWRKNWLKKAKKLVTGCDSLWH